MSVRKRNHTTHPPQYNFCIIIIILFCIEVSKVRQTHYCVNNVAHSSTILHGKRLRPVPFFALTIKVGPLEIMKTNLKYTKNSTSLNKMNLTNNKNNLYITTLLDKLMNGVLGNSEIKTIIN